MGPGLGSACAGWVLGFRVWGLGFRFRLWGLGFGVWGLRFGARGCRQRPETLSPQAPKLGPLGRDRRG